MHVNVYFLKKKNPTEENQRLLYKKKCIFEKSLKEETKTEMSLKKVSKANEFHIYMNIEILCCITIKNVIALRKNKSR